MVEADGLTWDAAIDGLCALPIRPLRPLEWGVDESGERLWLRIHEGREVWFRSRIAPALEALSGETSLPSLTQALLAADPQRSRSSAARSARHLVTGLAHHGILEVELPPVPGLLAGRYRIEQELGRGGVGVVWRATDLETGEDRVVKHAWNWTGPLAARDAIIQREAEVMARLDHPGVVRFHDRISHDGRCHLVRSFVDGQELGQLVDVEGPPVATERGHLLAATARVLDHLHRREVLCLDLKASNLMVPHQGPRVVLSDLGHARVLTADELVLQSPVGSRGYLAPEMLEENRAQPATDLFGLGRLAAFLILGRDPSPSWSQEQLEEEVRDAGASKEERGFIQACCARDPDARPASATAAIQRLSV